MDRKKLTKRAIDALPEATNPRGERYYDADLTGFGVAVYPSGKKSFFYEYGDRNHRRRITVGPYGALTPEDARAKATKLTAEVLEGADPIEERTAERGVPTFDAWVKTYLEYAKATKKSASEDVRYLGLAVKAFGRKKLTEVTSTDIAAIFDAYVADEKTVAANRFLASIRACLQRAWRHPYQHIQDNPARHLRPGKDATPRDRVLTDKEMERLADALAALPDPHVRAAFVIAAETGCRASEVIHARWEDVDLDAAVWRLPDTKAGKAQFIPLTPGVVAFIRTLPEEGPYLIPGRKADTSYTRSGLSKAWAKLRAEAKIPDVHVHDLRRTFGLRIARRAGLDVASKLLRHSSVKVTEQSYAPFGLDDLRPALDEGGRVIPLFTRKKETA